LSRTRRQRAGSFFQNRTLAGFLLSLILSGCSGLSLPTEDTPTSGPDPTYSSLVADHIKNSFKDYASYEGYEISEYRWVHSTKGWLWLTCVRFQDKGRRLTYALFIRQKEIVDNRYAVEADGCDAQTYSPFVLIGGRPAGSSGLDPLY
jgi:hypothetical protein